MLQRPKQLVWMSSLLAAVTIALPLIQGNFTALHAVIMLLAIPFAWLVQRASMTALIAVPAFTVLVLWNNGVAAAGASDGVRAMIALATLLYLGVLHVAFTPEVRALMEDPAARWWLTPARFRARLPVTVSAMINTNKEVRCTTFDVSTTGAFVSSSVIPNWLRPGMECRISIRLLGLRTLDARARVVRVSRGNGRYPAGLGLKFLGLGRGEKTELLAAIREQGA